jgi:hypothetical protein
MNVVMKTKQKYIKPCTQSKVYWQVVTTQRFGAANARHTKHKTSTLHAVMQSLRSGIGLEGHGLGLRPQGLGLEGSGHGLNIFATSTSLIT